VSPLPLIRAIVASALLCLTGHAAETEWQITDRDAHSQVRSRTSVEWDALAGRSVERRHNYIELATGLNYLQDGQFVPSREIIELLPDGFAVARQGQHQVIFNPNANSIGAVDLLAPDGARFRSRILGIICYDRATGASELIAELQDSVGELAHPNRIWYRDAFDGLSASVRLTYMRAGLEQDIILHERPALPPGFNPLTSQLQVWTEFFDPPVPNQRTHVLKQTPGLAPLTDVTLSFGEMKIGRGKAFALDNGDAPAPVLKEWTRVENRIFLIESVEWSALEPMLAQVPEAGNHRRAGGLAMNKSRDELIAAARKPLTRALSSERIQLARADSLPDRGLVIDYTLLTSSTNSLLRETRRISSPGGLTIIPMSWKVDLS
jgi:hypothetical protein